MNSQTRDAQYNVFINSDQVEIQEQTPDHHFRTELPNIIFELDLPPDAICVYAVLKKTAGDCGASWKSMATLCKECNIGETRLRICLQELACKDRHVAGIYHDNFPLIEIIHRKKENGSPDTNIIKIIPIWRKNGDFFRSKKNNTGSPREVGVVRHTKQGGSPREDKEEPSNKNPLKEATTTPITQSNAQPVAAVFSDELLKDLPLTPAEQASFALQFDNDQLKHMVAYYKGRLSVTPDFVPDSWASYLANATRNGYAVPQKSKPVEEKPPVDEKKNEKRANEAINYLTNILKEGEQIITTSLSINYRNAKGKIMTIYFNNRDFDLELNELYKIIKNSR